MAVFKEQLNYVTSIYVKNNEIDVLRSSLKTLKTLISSRDISPVNKELSLHLFFCTYCKIALLDLRDERFNHEISENYIINLENYLSKAQKNDLENAVLTLQNSIRLIKHLETVYEDYRYNYSLVFDNDNNIVINDIDKAKEISDYANKQMKLIEEYKGYNPFIDKISFIDLKEISLHLFKVLNDKTIEAVRTLNNKDIKRVFDEQCIVLDNEMANKYEYYPGLSNDINKNNGFYVLFSPFEIEAELATYYYEITKNKKFVVINALNVKVKDYDTLFNSISLLDYNVLVLNLENLVDNRKKSFLKGLYGLSKQRYVFVHNPYASILMYDEYVKYAKELDILKSYELSYVYINFPPFNSLIDILEKKNIISKEDDKERIRNELKFMGYYGLNVLINSYVFGKNWFEIAKSISDSNTSKVIQYLDNLPSQIQLIDYGWCEIETGKNYLSKQSVIYDYDNIHIVNKVNIKKIMNAKLPLDEKIGTMVQYVLLAGDDEIYFKELSKEDKESRIKLATELVYVIFGFDYLPEVIFEKDDLWAGLNVNRGQIIKYSTKYYNDFESIMNTICHECRHTFQHFAYSTYNENFSKVYGISKNMISEWRENLTHYSSLSSLDRDDKYYAYRYQVVEADANAFAQDCIDGAARSYNTINFE